MGRRFMDRPREGGPFRDRSLFPDLRRERRPLQILPEDGLHSAVRGLTEDERPAARRLQACLAVSFGEIEDPLRSPEPVDGPLRKHLRDELSYRVAERLGVLAKADRRHHHPGDLFRRVMQEVGDALPRLLGAGVGGDPLVLVVELDAVPRGAEPEDLADQAARSAVVGFLEDHVTVGMELGELEDGGLETGTREWEERRLFGGLKADERLDLGGAVQAGAGDVERPVTEILVGLVDVAEGAAGKGVAFDVVDAALHLALVLRGGHAAGGDRESVVLGGLPVGALDLGIPEAGAGDGSLEIVDDHPAGDAHEELPGMGMAGNPGLDPLVEDELGVEMAAVGEDDHERPGAAQLTAGRIQEHPRISEVDLSLLARRHLDPDERLRSGRGYLAEEAEDAGVAPLELILVAEDLEDGLGLDSLAMEPENLVPEGLDAGRGARLGIGEIGRASCR